MKKIFVIMMVLTIGFVSCTYNDTPPSTFVVKEILPRDGMKVMTTYKVVMLDASGIGETDFWIVDSVGKYKIGDRLQLSK